jgi:hypothetical protein
MDGFVAADAGLADFDPICSISGELPTYVLTDMVEEDFPYRQCRAHARS